MNTVRVSRNGPAFYESIQDPHVPASTKRRNRWILKNLLVFCGIVDGVLALLLLYMCLVHLPYLNLQQVDITGNRRLSRDEIIEISEINDGVNILTMDLNMVADKLRKHPWVRSATVYRRLPGRMIIEIDERIPRAIVAAEKLYYVDDQGAPFTRLLPGDSVDLPLFTGVKPQDLKDHTMELQELIRNGLGLLDQLDKTGSEFDPMGVSEIRLDFDEGIALHTRSGKQVIFGKNEFELKLQRYGRLKRYLTQRGEWNNARIINLDFEDRALVRSDKARLQG